MEQYEREYYEKLTTADNMIYDRFREKESLNGLWKYAVDQYDTCIRQKWNEEVYYDAGGNTLPVDFSFDEWETMELPCSWNTVDRPKQAMPMLIRTPMVSLVPENRSPMRIRGMASLEPRLVAGMTAARMRMGV